MKLFLHSYIEKFLKKAIYEYDKHTRSWCASVEELPGTYAQADTIEEVRNQLAEVIEDYIYVSLHQGHLLPNFKRITRRRDAKAYQA